MKTLSIPLAAAAALCAAAVACDFETTGNQLQSNRVMVATVLGTPPVELSVLGLAGLDGGFDIDAGLLPDAGLEDLGDGGVGTVTVPAMTRATIFFGERDRQSLDAPPSPIDGAEAFIRADADAQVALPEKGAGVYETSSREDETLEYRSGAAYTFTVQHDGQTYTAKVEDAPELERVEAFHPASGYIDHRANQSFTFQRPPAPAGQERNLGFVTVVPVTGDGQQGEPTWTNVPTTPRQFLELIARPGAYRADSVTVPGSAFPDKGATYVLTLQAVKVGRAESGNLFTGSAIVAGTAEVAVLRTREN